MGSRRPRILMTTAAAALTLAFLPTGTTAIASSDTDLKDVVAEALPERGIHLGADRWIGAGWWSGSSAPGPGRGCLVEATGPRARSSSPLRTSLLRLGVADEIAVGHWGRVHGTFQEA